MHPKERRVLAQLLPVVRPEDTWVIKWVVVGEPLRELLWEPLAWIWSLIDCKFPLKSPARKVNILTLIPGSPNPPKSSKLLPHLNRSNILQLLSFLVVLEAVFLAAVKPYYPTASRDGDSLDKMEDEVSYLGELSIFICFWRRWTFYCQSAMAALHSSYSTLIYIPPTQKTLWCSRYCTTMEEMSFSLLILLSFVDKSV